MDCPSNFPLAQMNLLAQAVANSDGGVSTGISSQQYLALGILAAVIILPVFLGNFIARQLRMADYGTRIAWVLFAVLASVATLSFGKLGLGVDLRGGTILVYQIDPTVGIQQNAEPTDPNDPTMPSRSNVQSKDLIASLIKRINPAGTQEIAIRPYGEDQVEIIVPAVDQLEVSRIKRTLEQAGILRFAIVANTRDHGRLIEVARTQAQSGSQRVRLAKTVMDVDGTTPLGFWAVVDREEKANNNGIRPLRVDVAQSILRNPADGRLVELPGNVFGVEGVAQWMKTQGLDNLQILMAVDSQTDVTGEDLAFASTGYDRDGSPCVRFKLTDAGSGRFYALTTNNSPDGQHFRYLGIVLDDKLLSAPRINQPIQGDGVISGKFSTEEVEELVRILQAGQLPAALTKQPIAENLIDATLGADTINKGFVAAGASMIAVLLFMLVYYRFAGVISCFALILNLVMTVAFMILISQPLTLPGLAGLVLTVGMSVDANVLIFERIREEVAKGAAARMAIRNGFARATTTIIDANLTTLITAIVLYAIGTDQIRGFAVTLILGIIFSMFTAISVSRTLFDIAERKGFLSLSMSNAVATLRDSMTAGKGFDFMSYRRAAYAFSLLLCLAGLVAIVARGRSIFDIDFSGGSSITFRLEEPTTTDKVRDVVGKILNQEGDSKVDFTVNNVSVENAPQGTVFKVDTSIDDIDALKQKVSDGINKDASLKLMTYKVEIKPADASQSSVAPRNENGVRLVALQAQDAAPADTASTDNTPAETKADEKASPETANATGAESTKPATPADSATSEAKPGDADQAKPAVAADVVSRSRISLAIEGSQAEKARINSETLVQNVMKAATEAGIQLDPAGIELEPIGENAEQWAPGSDLRFSDWEVGLPLEFGPADEVMGKLKSTLDNDPIWIGSSSVGSRVAGDMINRAIGAMVASLLAIIAYIWFRFNRAVYGFAAVIALIHDVLITVGAIAVSQWVYSGLGFLQIDQFKISLTVVAALLTVIGYSLNDTIVVFDRIREVKGKSLRLTGTMINDSINSTLSRTLLTSGTTLLVVVVLYFFGGEGIHSFAFSLLVGIGIGTYSSIFVASPMLLWLAERNNTPAAAK